MAAGIVALTSPAMQEAESRLTGIGRGFETSEPTSSDILPLIGKSSQRHTS